MIQRKTKREIQLMKEAGELLAACHKELRALIKPGVTTLQLDSFVEDFLEEHGATPEQKGYQDYPFATCASVNDVICHGFPNTKKLEEGDIVTIDMVVNLNGALADSAWSYAVGEISEEKQKLLDTTKKSLYVGIEQAVIGNRIGDIGHAIQQYAEGEGFGVVRDFTGHGIGPTLHEEPMIPHFGQPGTGMRLKEGMVITIEPMLNTGVPYSQIDEDGWTARTLDGSLSAQYEHTIAITSEGPVILTMQEDE
ncbi:type I methionyl aminopeptidase [Alkalihalobacillus sp. CinArs1]|uniref:type I methionyl aminopeptidase n=1 Tax=Alkalihalobacillus sp. CinArs1 TaxID=2995314 RepID=UPI0022DDDF6D|nr:type I methionyl aminopeptidase [Alkalihalobacillus sp. CinArs1]